MSMYSIAGQTLTNIADVIRVENRQIRFADVVRNGYRCWQYIGRKREGENIRKLRALQDG